MKLLASSHEFDIEVLVNPGTDLDGVVKALDLDTQELVFINGWLFIFEEV